jgi:hypothetical protein
VKRVSGVLETQKARGLHQRNFSATQVEQDLLGWI